MNKEEKAMNIHFILTLSSDYALCAYFYLDILDAARRLLCTLAAMRAK